MLLVAAVSAGCAGPRAQGPQFAGPFSFPDESNIPRVVIYGGLDGLLPEYDETPTLDLFLYGPNDYGKTIARNPQGMAVLGQRLLVCDQGRPAVVAMHLDSGKSLPWGGNQFSPRCPVDVAVDEAGFVYVADTTIRSVLVHDAAGRFVQELKPESGPESRFRPTSVLVRGGVMYVGDAGRRQVARYDVNARQWLDPLTPPATMRPVVAPTGLAMTADGTLLIVESIGGYVLRMTREGQWLAPLGRSGRRPGEFVRPKSVAVTPSGMIFVTDAARQSVQGFTARGEFALEVTEQAQGWKGFTLPSGIISASLESMPQLQQTIAEKGWAMPDELLIVSDSLGSPQVVVMGVITGQRREVARGN